MSSNLSDMRILREVSRADFSNDGTKGMDRERSYDPIRCLPKRRNIWKLNLARTGDVPADDSLEQRRASPRETSSRKTSFPTSGWMIARGQK